MKTTMKRIFLTFSVLIDVACVGAFSTQCSMATPIRRHQAPSTPPPSPTALYLSSTATSAASDVAIQEAKQLLCRAAETKSEDAEKVLEALNSLERNCKAKFREDPSAFSKDIMDNISGDWRLIFTTGTKERQRKSGGRVNYFPLKAVQKFDTSVDPNFIENGIYVGDFPLVRFSGDFDFDSRRRKLEFDFDLIEILGLFKIRLGRKDVAKIGASTGLGSANNEKLADAGRRAFFDWISADNNIATARGGGGGLALWKRVD